MSIRYYALKPLGLYFVYSGNTVVLLAKRIDPEITPKIQFRVLRYIIFSHANKHFCIMRYDLHIPGYKTGSFEKHDTRVNSDVNSGNHILKCSDSEIWDFSRDAKTFSGKTKNTKIAVC